MFICEGTKIKDQNNREGIVILIDRNSNIAVIQSYTRTWTDNINNLKFISYMEVE